VIFTISRARYNPNSCEIYLRHPIWNGFAWSGTFWEKDRQCIEAAIGRGIPKWPHLVFFDDRTRETWTDEHEDP